MLRGYCKHTPSTSFCSFSRLFYTTSRIAGTVKFPKLRTKPTNKKILHKFVKKIHPQHFFKLEKNDFKYFDNFWSTQYNKLKKLWKTFDLYIFYVWTHPSSKNPPHTRNILDTHLSSGHSLVCANILHCY